MSNTEHPSPRFPQEILNRFLDELNSDGTRESKLALAACSLASKSLLHRSRELLFSTIELEVRSKDKDAEVLRDMLNILRQNEHLRSAIRTLDLRVVPEYPVHISQNNGFEDGNIPLILPMLTNMRHFSLSEHDPSFTPIPKILLQWPCFSHDIQIALSDLRFLPHLTELTLYRVAHVPLNFVLQWSGLRRLKLDDACLVDGNDVATAFSTLHINSRSQPKLRELTLNTATFLDVRNGLSTSTIFSQLWRIDITPSPSLPRSYVWNVIGTASQTLEVLYLRNIFQHPGEICAFKSLPSLKSISISDEGSDGTMPERVYKFLASALSVSRTCTVQVTLRWTTPPGDTADSWDLFGTLKDHIFPRHALLELEKVCLDSTSLKKIGIDVQLKYGRWFTNPRAMSQLEATRSTTLEDIFPVLSISEKVHVELSVSMYRICPRLFLI